MKEKIKNCLASTALSLILLCVLASIYEGRYLCINTVYQVFLANIILHLTLSLLARFESSYFLVEISVEFALFITIALIFAAIFDWYSSTPLWMLLFLCSLVFLIANIIDLYKMSNKLTYINKQLKDLRENQ
ncbi:MAG TPA: hypothetical protein PLL17_06670 [Defluviitaleaceae bacterium]|nr:hypothetical protein [Candidatus Epulonipiscium sp.]HOQ16652.1 hypothetical protein [Defluviitaleaceae bacterium]HPT75212.1 hypothetical protein [Defluviitaleaceae bacterium]HQD50798.1 hypothetical protein [Defluviitaleaceae bacterium]